MSGGAYLAAHFKAMTVQINIDEKLMSQIDVIVGDLQIDRAEYFRKLAEEDLIARQYADAYRKYPVQPDEFEIEDEQMEKFWDQV